MTFPLRPLPRPGEPALGYLLRIAEANGYDWRTSSFASRGISKSDLARGRTSALVPMLRRETVDLLDLSTPRVADDGTFLLCGERFHPAQILLDRKRFCTFCWAGDLAVGPTHGLGSRHLRCWWSVAALTCCPIHRRRLQDSCHRCRRPTRLSFGSLSICRCGADLSRIHGPTVECEDLDAEAYVFGRLGALPKEPDRVLDGLPLGDAIDLMQRLGCCLSAGRDVRFGKLDPERRPGMLLAGFHAIRHGNEAVEDALEALLEGPGHQDRLRVQLGQFYAWFAALPDGPLQAWIAERVANIVRRNRISWQNWGHHVVDPPTPDRISASEAKHILGFGWDRATSILDAAGLRTDLRERCRPTVDRRQVEAVAERIGRLVDVAGLAPLLGITPNSVRMLLRAQLLPMDPLGRAAFAYPRFDPLEVERSLVSMTGSVPIVDAAPAGTIPLTSAARMIGIVPLCQAMIEGRITAAGRVPGMPGFKGILVRAAGILEASRPPGSAHVGLVEAQRRLGLRGNGLSLVVAAGHLPVVRDARGRRCMRRSDVERFKACYVSTTELARVRRSSARAVLARIASAGGRPAIELAAGGVVEVRLFRRREADEFLGVVSASARQPNSFGTRTPAHSSSSRR